MFGVAYEDDHLLVVDKPAGVVVHPGAGNEHGTLAQALAGRAAGGPDPDAARASCTGWTATRRGCWWWPSPKPPTPSCRRMIRDREVTRRYLALVDGRPPAASGTIDAPLGRDRRRRTVMSSDTDKPREAVTHFELVEALPRTTLLDVTLQTGRTHQIRAHMLAIGHPVCGDPRYGGSGAGARLGLTRQFLHAHVLMFRHPETREELWCESKPPADLRRALDAARREPVSGGPDGH